MSADKTNLSRKGTISFMAPPVLTGVSFRSQVSEVSIVSKVIVDMAMSLDGYAAGEDRFWIDLVPVSAK